MHFHFESTTTAMEEHEFSVVFSVPSSLYSSLYLTLKSAPQNLYTPHRFLIKNIFNDIEGDGNSNGCIRTVQDAHGFMAQRKNNIAKTVHRRIYCHAATCLTLLLEISEKTSIEADYEETSFPTSLQKQTLRDYVFCRRTGMRICVERHYEGGDGFTLEYDCLNRYKYECTIHVEWEEAPSVDAFVTAMTGDNIIYRLLETMSRKNINNTGDEIINIHNMNLIHPYGHCGLPEQLDFFSLKFDGIRKNFCIFGRYFQIAGGQTYTFSRHWFGQAIVGHCEILESGEEVSSQPLIVLIDVYLIVENFHRLAKKYNMSYTCVLQNYHQFAEGGGSKTQDEYFHAKRLRTNIDFLNPCEAIEIIKLLEDVWRCEGETIGQYVSLQKFFRTLDSLPAIVVDNEATIDGCLGYNEHQIVKFKDKPTIDLMFRFDEMYRTLCKRMKNHQHEMKKIIKFINIQKTCDWLLFEEKFPGKFKSVVAEFLYFAHNRCFGKYYKEWSVDIDLRRFTDDLKTTECTSFVLLLEFNVNTVGRQLIYNRLRNDKFSANSVHVFKEINKISA